MLQEPALGDQTTLTLAAVLPRLNTMRPGLHPSYPSTTTRNHRSTSENSTKSLLKASKSHRTAVNAYEKGIKHEA